MSEMSPSSLLLCGLAWQRTRRGQQVQAWRWQGRRVSPREHKSTTAKNEYRKKECRERGTAERFCTLFLYEGRHAETY